MRSTRRAQDEIGDDLLRLIFTACHPVLSTEARVALTLKLLGGLTTHEIARAFLVPEPTIAQRIVRAKRTLREAQVPFEVPRGEELARAAGLGAGSRLPRLQRGLHRHRGRGLDAARRWRDEALRLGRMLAELAPRRAGGARPGRADGAAGLAHGGAHRRAGPPDAAGRPGPRALGPAADPPRPGRAGARRGAGAASAGRYALQAAIAACHARARDGRRRPTGSASPRSTASWPGRAVAGGGAQSRRGRRHGLRAGGGPGDRRALARGPGAAAATSGCPACAATCWPSWAGGRRRAKLS